MYEHRTHQMLMWPAFVRRVRQHVFLALAIVLGAVASGSVGYHLVSGLGWIDAFLNASMILSGMGPVDRMDSDAAKIFSACYALFSGLVFIGVTGILTAPWLHRLLHWFHLEQARR